MLLTETQTVFEITARGEYLEIMEEKLPKKGTKSYVVGKFIIILTQYCYGS
jgi:hypothetical protein